MAELVFPHAPVHARLRNDPTLLDTSKLCVCMFPLVEEICLVAVVMDSPDTSPNVHMVVIQHIGLLCNERGLKRFTCISHIKHFPKLKLVCRNCFEKNGAMLLVVPLKLA